MARLGKILVLVNLIAAVGLLMWAVTLMSNRLDYDAKSTSENPMLSDTNSIERMESKINALNSLTTTAQSNFLNSSNFLTAEENSRMTRKLVMFNRIENAKNGKFFLQETLPGGLLNITATIPDEKNPNDVNRIIYGIDGKPLEGLDQIFQKLKQSVSTQNASLDSSILILKESEKTTTEIRLLQEEIEKQKVIFTNSIEEGKYLSDRRTNWLEQVKTLEQKAKQFEQRLKELASKK